MVDTNPDTNPDADPDSRIRTSDERIRMRIREAQKLMGPDPEHWYIYIILKR